MTAFPDVNWITNTSHPASGVAYQLAEVNDYHGDPRFVPGQFARVVKGDDVLYGPDRNTGETLREYQRITRQAMADMGLPEFQPEGDDPAWERENALYNQYDQLGKERPSGTYADHMLSKISTTGVIRLKIRDDSDGETHWLRVSPESFEKIRDVLRNAPEGQW